MDESETIFITGGTGYLGKLVLARLCEQATAADWNKKVVVLSRDPESFRAKNPDLTFPGLEFLKGEIETFAIPPEMRIDWVLHGATPSDAPSTPEEARATWNSSFGGTKHLTDVFLARSRAGIRPPRHLLYLSSGAVYGPQPATIPLLPETYSAPSRKASEPLNPAETYGEAKRASETLLLGDFTKASGIPVSIARIFACAGPGIPLAGRFALGQFIRTALESRKIVIGGDGTAVRSFIEGSELAHWLLRILASPEKRGIYNVGSESELTIREVAEAVKGTFSEAGIDVQIEIQGKPSAEQGAGHRYVPSVAKMGEVFGLKPVLNSREAIQKTTRWALSQLQG